MIRASISATHQAAGTSWIDGHLMAAMIVIPIISYLIVGNINARRARKGRR